MVLSLLAFKGFIMILYVVYYDTNYERADVISYHLTFEGAQAAMAETNKNNPGIGAYIEEIEVVA